MEILGVDIGGSGIKGAIVDTKTGELKTERLRIPTPKPATPEAMAETLKELVTQIGWKGPIACGFPARVVNGVVYTAANIDKSWLETPVEKVFSDALGQEVFVANDADVAGIAEMHFGAGRAYQRGKAMVITIGTGIGSALFLDGKLYTNSELGHVLLHGDSAERYCADSAREREGLKWKDFGKRFNEYLSHIEFILAPDVFILGGGASKKFDKFKDELTVKAPVIPAESLNLAGIIGAAMYGEIRVKQAKELAKEAKEKDKDEKGSKKKSRKDKE